jgi:hypothetical protein
LLGGAPKYQIVEPHRTVRSRVTRWALRGMWRLFYRSLRRLLWRWRRSLLPWYAAVAVWVCAAAASVTPRGWTTMLLAAGLGALPMWRWLGLPMWRFTKRRGLKPASQRIMYGGFYALLTVWGAVAAVWTVGRPWLAMLVLPTFAVWIARLWHHRGRKEPVEELGEYEQLWAQIDGLTGTSLVNLRELDDPKRLQFTVDLSKTKHLTKHVTDAIPMIAKEFGVTPGSVVVKGSPRGVETSCEVVIVHSNSCDDPIPYDETWIPTKQDVEEGCVPLHSYPHGARGRVRYFLKGAGCVNTMASGDPRVGKSQSIETLLTQLAFTGMVWPVAGDPQGGVSMPTWCGRHNPLARWAGLDRDAIYDQMLMLVDIMHARSEALAHVRYVDEWGDEQIGVNCWDPSKVDWPIIAYAIDEAWSLTGDPDFKPLFVRLLKMMGKCGMKMILATHYPALGEFGNEEAIRQAFTAGNLLAFRNTGTATKNMILPSGMPGPDGIPQETGTGNHTKGMLVAASAAPRSSLPVYSRSVWMQRARFWGEQAQARIPERLDPISAPIWDHYINGRHRCSDCRELQGLCACQKEQAGEREQVTVSGRPGTVVPISGPVIVRAIEFLKTNGPATSGVIAQALGEKLPAVGMALSRGKAKNVVHEIGDGRNVWAAGPEPVTETATNQEEAA